MKKIIFGLLVFAMGLQAQTLNVNKSAEPQVVELRPSNFHVTSVETPVTGLRTILRKMNNNTKINRQKTDSNAHKLKELEKKVDVLTKQLEVLTKGL